MTLLPKKGNRLGDVRVAPGRRKVEILVAWREDGSAVWIPFVTHLKTVLVATCPNCCHTDRLKEFLK